MGDVVVVAFRGDVADARGAEGIICDCVGVIPLFVILVDDAAARAEVEAAAACCAFVRDAPLTPPVGDELAFWKPERARNAEKKLEKNGRFVDMVVVCEA